MDRLSILVGQLYKSLPPTKYFFKVQLVGRFIALVGVISRPVESPLIIQLLIGVIGLGGGAQLFLDIICI